MSAALLRRHAGVNLRRVQWKTKPPPRRFQTTTPSPKGWTSPATTSAVVAGSSIFLAASAAAYALGAIYPPPTLKILFPRVAPAPPDPTSSESIAYTQALEQELQTLPLLETLRERPDAAEWYEVRPYKNFPEERRVNSLTSGALRGPGKLALYPLARVKKDESESYVFTHLGRGLCGHDGIIHGGLLATLLDETLARTAIANLPDQVGVTAQLTLNYRAPTRADQFVVIRTFLEEAKGRKVTVNGRVESLDGTVLVEASATFVQPRYAKLLNTEALKQAMGEPPKAHTPIHLGDGLLPSK